MPRLRPSRRPRSGFTLVELVVVILVLGILAGVAAPRFLDVSEEGQQAVAAALVRSVADQVELEAARTGSLPAQIEASWFQNNQLPDSPYNSLGVPEFQIADQPGRDHPPLKVIDDASLGAMWYNRATGAVRIRVPEQRNAILTLQLYNAVNYDTVGAIDGTANAVALP